MRKKKKKKKKKKTPHDMLLFMGLTCVLSLRVLVS
jgi:hypothetical protein